MDGRRRFEQASSVAAIGPHPRALAARALHIELVGREWEMNSACEHLLSEVDQSGRMLVVHGDSGTGKTFFSRKLIYRLGKARPDALYLYIDVANDEYQSSRTIASLLKMALVPGSMTATTVIQVPEPLSLERYQRQVKRRALGRGFLKSAAQAVGTFFGAGPSIGAALGGGDGEVAQVGDELAGYLAWVARKQLVFVAIDNIQFLNLDTRLTIESILQRVDRNVRLLAVDRTLDGASELEPPLRCFSQRKLEVLLGNLSAEETRQVVVTALDRNDASAEKLADDIYTKTNGLAKDVEYCLRKYVLELGRGARAEAIEGLLATIDRLPLIHRQLLMIATLLDGGVRKGIAEGTIRRLAALHDDRLLDVVVGELIAREYLRINSESGDRLRPGHERIAMAIRDLADEDLQEDVRRSLVQELASALDAPDAAENETYLLHCLVGLQTARELSRSIHYISRLIQSQYRQDQFSYLVAIAAELQEILPMLPEHVLEDMLDAMQKSSAFEQGLQLVHELDAAHVPGERARRIHRLKYLTQAYRYDEALSLSHEMDEGGWGDVYRVNALLALDRLDDARQLVETHRAECLSEDQAVMRRNTVILYEPERALADLDEAYAYFEREQSHFRLATVETNRSLVYLNERRFGDALRSLDRAVYRMDQVGSGEVYQAQINLAVRSALKRNYEAALESLDAASLHVPRALILDQVKIAMNRCVIECAAGTINLDHCARDLLKDLEQIRGLQMPYLQRTLEKNLMVARGASPSRTTRGRVSLSVDLPTDQAPVEGAWTLLMSIHWRY